MADLSVATISEHLNGQSQRSNFSTHKTIVTMNVNNSAKLLSLSKTLSSCGVKLIKRKQGGSLLAMSHHQFRSIQTLAKRNNPGFFDVISGMVCCYNF